MAKKQTMTFRLSGAPDTSRKELDVKVDKSVYEIKRQVRKAYNIHKGLAIQLIKDGKVLNDICKISHLIGPTEEATITVDGQEKKPKRSQSESPITVMPIHSGG